MPCKYAEFYIGQHVHLTVTDGNCVGCGAKLNFGGEVIYQGHNTDGPVPLDLFDFVVPSHCPECEYEVVQYQQECI